MIKAVLDINVFISALFWSGAPHQIFRKMIEGEFLNFISSPILEELREKLANKFNLPPEKIKEFLELIVFSSQTVEVYNTVNVVQVDPKDNKIIECAKAAGASFIVSGDKHLLNLKNYEGIEIVSPSKFLGIC